MWDCVSPLSVLRPDSQVATVNHPNHLNTPRLVADASQNPVWKWDQQEAFGDTPPDENPAGMGTFEFPMRLSRGYADKETGKVYTYFRDYSPNDGRFVQSDLIGLYGGANTYSFVYGRPLQVRDPSGLWGTEAHNAIIRAAFPNVNPALLLAIQAGSGNVDLDQSTAGAPLHAMSRLSDGPNRVAIAKQDACKFAQDRLAIFHQYKGSTSASEQYAAYFALGEALHPIMDSTSPVHGWAIWNSLLNPRNMPSVAQHGDGAGSRENLKALTPELLAKTIGLINQAVSGDACGCFR
jgi:RHS repeat-associated protein